MQIYLMAALISLSLTGQASTGENCQNLFDTASAVETSFLAQPRTAVTPSQALFREHSIYMAILRDLVTAKLIPLVDSATGSAVQPWAATVQAAINIEDAVNGIIDIVKIKARVEYPRWSAKRSSPHRGHRVVLPTARDLALAYGLDEQTAFRAASALLKIDDEPALAAQAFAQIRSDLAPNIEHQNLVLSNFFSERNLNEKSENQSVNNLQFITTAYFFAAVATMYVSHDISLLVPALVSLLIVPDFVVRIPHWIYRQRSFSFVKQSQKKFTNETLWYTVSKSMQFSQEFNKASLHQLAEAIAAQPQPVLLLSTLKGVLQTYSWDKTPWGETLTDFLWASAEMSPKTQQSLLATMIQKIVSLRQLRDVVANNVELGEARDQMIALIDSDIVLTENYRLALISNTPTRSLKEKALRQFQLLRAWLVGIP